MQSGFFDNRTRILKDDLVAVLKEGGSVSIASSVFSMYAYRELREQLESIDEFRFIFTSPAFLKERHAKEQREFYIPRLDRERSVGGTDLEIRLRNELTQKAVATECANWIRRKARFKSFRNAASLPPALTAEVTDFCGVADTVSYLPINGFTTVDLGVERSADSYSAIVRQETSSSRQLLKTFEQAWNSEDLDDVTDAVVDNIAQMYRENPPELVYYAALYRIFHEFLDDITADELPKEGVGFRESKIWNLLYDFQRDAVLAIVNKLQTYNGCILADSVGLGKTFTALAVVKYYESLNRNVLVLCPKKLGDNWLMYRNNQRNNPIAEDRLRYDVLYHTDLSRERGISVTGIDLETFNWGAYDLVVIDESHNFRNGEDSAKAPKDGEEAKENRYQRLLNRVVCDGVSTKVLMLSATPVNNRFRDLRNQLALAYQGDSNAWSERLGLDTNIESVFRNAQKAFNAWQELDTDKRTTEALTASLDMDFFRVLDQVTVARSRSHIQRYYDASAIGPFPRRNKPVSRRPDLSVQEGAATYDRIADRLYALELSIYVPIKYVQPSKRHKYIQQGGNLSVEGRERGVQRLMAANLLKRLESSVASFRLTLERVLAGMNNTLDTIAAFKENAAKGRSVPELQSADFDFDFDDADAIEFMVGSKKAPYDLRDMDWVSWERDIASDVAIATELLGLVEEIDPSRDAKLVDLKRVISDKVAHPINAGNKKIIVFTAFADTADYLYEQLKPLAAELGLGMAEVTGTSGCKTTVAGVRGDLSEVLTCFSPVSKERDKTYARLAGKDVDLLIATDCISEGQNLQDGDFLVNYDIHWNPVRVVQRFGRIDRIGSKNDAIQLVNYWPNVALDKYINLKERVENRMHATVMASTGDDDYINEDEKGDLEYRRAQLEQMQNEVVDLEDVAGGVSITDLGLNDFRMDLVAYYEANPSIERVPAGINAVVSGDEPGIVFVLRNVNQELDAAMRNPVHPFYLVYVKDDGETLHGYLDPKETLDAMRRLCRGKSEPDAKLCRAYNRATKDGRDMSHASKLLETAVLSMVSEKREADVDSFFSAGTTSFLENDVAGLDDFELVCFLVVR